MQQVYIGKCKICEKEYCGESCQFFGARVGQHHSGDSALQQHYHDEHPEVEEMSIAWKIYSKTKGYVERKISEALALKLNRFEINRKAEGSGVVDLYW